MEDRCFLVPHKKCPRCKEYKPLTEDFFYIARARKGHKEGWQSYCIECWKLINKERR